MAIAPKFRWLLLAALLALAGCVQPWQQLALPEPGPTATATGSVTRSTPLSGGAVDTSREPRAQIGSGELTGQPDPRPIVRNEPVRDGVTVSLAEASVSAAARAILGDILKVPYSVSEKVKGSVTLQTSKPVGKDALIDTFEDVLRAQGAALVSDGSGGYKILPVEDAVAQGAPVLARGATRRGPGMATEIVPLQHVAAPEMERILRSMVPSSIVLRADAARNVIVVTGTRAELASLADIVAVFDVDTMRGMSFAILPVEAADPEAVAQELDTVFANDRDGPTKGMVRFIGNRRLKAVLAISPRKDYLEKAERWLRRLDQVSQETQKRVFVYHVQNRPVQELAALLQKVYLSQDQGRASASATPVASPAIATPISSAPGNGGNGAAPTPLPQPIPQPLAPATPVPQAQVQSQVQPLSAQTGAITTAGIDPPPQVRAGLSGFVDDRAAGVGIVPDDKNNMLVITATAGEYKRLRQILTQIDVASAQILLEATIAEVTLTDQLKMGLRWYFQNSKNGFKLTDDALGSVAPVFPGFSYFLNAPNVQVTLKALSQITDVNVVSSPTLMVLDNHKAVLQVGDEVPIATQSAVGVIAPGAPIVNSISFRNTGILLSLTPRVSDQGRVLLDVEQEVSDVVPTKSSNIDSPTIQQRRVRTTVAVNDGESIVLAGLMQDRASRARDQVPVLGDVPVVGNLFKSKTDEIRRTELLIAITPRVVKDVHALRGITSEFRDKLNFSTRPQRQGPPDRREQVDRILR